MKCNFQLKHILTNVKIRIVNFDESCGVRWHFYGRELNGSPDANVYWKQIMISIINWIEVEELIPENISRIADVFNFSRWEVYFILHHYQQDTSKVKRAKC